MTDPKDAGRKENSQGGKRVRSRIYGERHNVSLRMSPDLRNRIMVLCDELNIPANTYIVGLVEADLKRRKK